MNVTRRLKSLLGTAPDGPSAADSDPDADPSHVCRTCGAEYFTDPDADIRSCRDCGGTKVERA